MKSIKKNHDFSNIDIPMCKQGYVNDEAVSIGDDVWIGFGSTILKGVKIGNGCVIGANTVITTDIEEYSVVVGSPSRTIRKVLKVSDLDENTI